MCEILRYIGFLNEVSSYIEYPPPSRIKLNCFYLNSFYIFLTLHFKNISQDLHHLTILVLKKENRFYIGTYYAFMEPILNTYFLFKNIQKQVCPARSLK